MNKQVVFVHSDYNGKAGTDMLRSVLNEMKNNIEYVVVPMQQQRVARAVKELGIPHEEYPLEYLSYSVYFNAMVNMFMPSLFIVHVAYPSAQTHYIAQFAKMRHVPLKYV